MGIKLHDKITMFLGELIGTAMLMFLGCMGCLSWDGKPISPLQSSLAFGMVVMLIIQTFGCVSGAHLNPVVTLAAIVYDMISVQMACIYFVAQMLGALMGYGLLMVITPAKIFNSSGSNGTSLCVTAPYAELSSFQAVAIEYTATTILILICGGVWDPRNAKHQDSIPLKFGFAITAIGMIIGPFTGASMNPVRSFSPAYFNDEFKMHWIYWLGPLPAGFITALIYKYVFRREVENENSSIYDLDRKENANENIPLKSVA